MEAQTCSTTAGVLGMPGCASCLLPRIIPDRVLNERSLILRLTPYIVVHDAETDHGARHQYAVVHVLWSGRCRWGPETPEKDEENIDTCEGVVNRAEKTR